jgi:hypothetical protein
MAKNINAVKDVKLKTSDFSYIDQIANVSYPKIVLGIQVPSFYFEEHYPYKWRELKFTKSRTWIKLAHQSGGISCNQSYFFATFLNPKSTKVLENIILLQNKWFESNVGAFGTSLDSIIEYREDIKKLFGVDCNSSWKKFQESVYPIDCTDENIKKLTDESFPEDLDNLIDWNNGFERAAGCIGRWSLCILTENSD